MSEKNGKEAAEAVAKAGRYLTFQMGKEIYGIEILKVQEIIGLMPITHVPRTPDYVRGVINLRGKVIPVIDLRRKVEKEGRADTDQTCIGVVQISWTAGTVTLGMLVDEVSEVLNVNADQIEAPPSFGTRMDTDFILGMGKVGQKVVMLLDVDKVLAMDEIAAVGVMG